MTMSGGDSRQPDLIDKPRRTHQLHPPRTFSHIIATVRHSKQVAAGFGTSACSCQVRGGSSISARFSVQEMSTQDTEPQAWEEGHAQYQGKELSKYVDPCQEAANKSLKCLRRNGGARDMCSDYFDAYRECKKSWQLHVQEEKRKQKKWF